MAGTFFFRGINFRWFKKDGTRAAVSRRIFYLQHILLFLFGCTRPDNDRRITKLTRAPEDEALLVTTVSSLTRGHDG